MGILGFQKLQTEDVVGGCVKIKMMDKLREWKLMHPDQQATVVIRLKELLMAVVQLNVKAAIFGGSHRYYHEQLDNFFQQFQDLKVKLVFFGGGTKTKDKLTKLTMKIDQDYRKYSKLLGHVDKKNEIIMCSRPELRVCLGLYEEGIARKYGEYFLSTGSLNKDIVQYCHENPNVAAVLANDSDFLLYDLQSTEYWSCGVEHLNFNDMTTLFFNKTALLDHLKLSPFQFHAMLAIAGVILDDAKKHSYCVSKDVLKKNNPGTIQIIKSISDCVRDKVPEIKEKPNFGAWTSMTFKRHLEEYCWFIEKMFKKYDVCWSTTSVAEKSVDTNVQKFKNIWSIVNDEVIRVDYNFLDLNIWQKNRNAMPYQNVVVKVLKRAIGIVLHAQKDKSPKRRFLIKGHEGERCKVLTKTLVFPPFEVPMIGELISDTNPDEEYVTKKWNLFYWVLHLDFDDNLKQKIRKLPKGMLPVVVTVLFLIWEHQITPMEGDSIIISENDMLNHVPDNDKVDYPTKPDGRTIRVSHIYVHSRVLINRCFQICGIELFNIPVLFDGIHFHNLMNEFVRNASKFEDKKAEIAELQIDAF